MPAVFYSSCLLSTGNGPVVVPNILGTQYLTILTLDVSHTIELYGRVNFRVLTFLRRQRKDWPPALIRQGKENEVDNSSCPWLA